MPMMELTPQEADLVMAARRARCPDGHKIPPVAMLQVLVDKLISGHITPNTYVYRDMAMQFADHLMDEIQAHRMPIRKTDDPKEPYFRYRMEFYIIPAPQF